MSLLKGWLGEKATQFGMWLRLDGRVYQRLHNVVIPADNGTTQIDHLLVSIYGIFVIETKNKGGWIFGGERDRQWTQSIFGKKYSFQNPLHQNYRHTQCLSAFLHLDHELFHSVVFFIGDCTFKTEMPRNVLDRGLSSYIRRFQTPVLTPDQVTEIVRQLTAPKRDSTLSNRQHVRSLNARFSSATTCPKCSGTLVQRTARTGKNAGNSFTGCNNYPRCKFTRPVAG